MPDSPLIGPHGHDFSDVARCLSAFRGERIVFVPNAGNAGDNLINLAACLLFDRLGLDWEPGAQATAYPGRAVVYGGGGSLVPLYPAAAEGLRLNRRAARAVVVLPHTVRAHAGLIAELDERVTIFARETPSRDYVAAAGGGAALGLSHDLAFLLDRETIAGLPWAWAALLRRRRIAWARMLVKFAWRARMVDPVLHCQRMDAEDTGATPHPLNADMSRNFATGDQSCPVSVNVAKMLVRVIDLYDRVETNRLHIAILSAILGKPVAMRDNSYGKNRAVWEHSMRERFPNVAFETGA